MCGIVGYIGCDDSKEILIKGLEKLEYRGYDSSGIALINSEGVFVFKDKGRIAHLKEIVDENVKASVGIGHTRWATHGVPNKINAHPHQSNSGNFTLVHNGVIENYEELKSNYLSDTPLKSNTDTEVIVQLISKFANEGMITEVAFTTALSLLHGSYAIALLDSRDENVIYVAKNKSPLLIGVGNGFNVITSDAMATIQLTNKYLEIFDKEIVIVKRESVDILTMDGENVKRDPFVANIDSDSIDKGTFSHYMLKEIHEQPMVIRKIIQMYDDGNGKFNIDDNIINAIKKADRIYIIACGTSYHAGLIGKKYIESFAKIPTEVHIASEFSYNTPLLSENAFFIFISQSGETADSRTCLVKIKERGYKSLTLTNVNGSTLSRESDYTLLLNAGPEIAVASTKAFVAQLTVLSILANSIGEASGFKFDFELIKELGIVANGISAICEDHNEFEKIAKEYLKDLENSFFIGRGQDYFVCLEGALKLKEISYIHSEGFAGGELKHGTIALIEENTPVFALSTQEHVNLSIRGNVQEVISRGANTCIISTEKLRMENDRYVLPNVYEMFTPLISVVPFQFIAYYAALLRGCDVDKPRNLAKSVTVE